MNDDLIKGMSDDLRYIRGKFDKLPCADQRVRIENLDGRLTPIEKIVWKLVLGALTLGGLAGAVTAAIAGK